ncbi:hypothetical protein TELCIR_00816 [Teladorsagia circumcincta]|uniref:Uncharacterized protein n=1 Tax=Teladorsagia circumcincta TaxID=45464 RepID=A0A2G9V3M0_TELCI|nr:hypothetical protein TELCIR_00816 [Teladorsagia circumcincta]
MERRRSRRSLAVVNRRPAEEDEEPTQHRHTDSERRTSEAAMSTEVHMHVSAQAAGDEVIAHLGKAPVPTIKDEPMEAGTATDELPHEQRAVLDEEAVAEVVLAKDSHEHATVSMICYDGKRVDEVTSVCRVVQGSAQGRNFVPPDEVIPTSSSGSTDNSAAPSTEAPKSSDMEVDVVLQPQVDVEMVECVQTEKENQHGEEESLHRSVRLASTPSSTPAAARSSRKTARSVPDESTVTSRAVSTPNKPISDVSC